MEKFFIYSHIFCGALVLLLGLMNIVSKKGTRRHVLIGRTYVGAMWWICLSALSLTTFYRFSMFLMVIAVITFYTSFVGLRVLRRRKLGSEQWYDWTASILTGLFGIGLLIYAGMVFFSGKNEVLGILSFVFGVLAFNMGFQEIRFFVKAKTDEKKWWLYQHIGAISGSYIAAVTAFAVQNGEALGVTNHNWLLWVLPGVIGSVVISITIKKRRKRDKVALHP
ncbi:MAG: hypothetical protein ABJG78_16820 [Cyclobacteriaceae bacterium]